MFARQASGYHPFFRPACKAGMRVLSRRYTNYGAENVPEGPFIIVINHMSYFDPMALGASDVTANPVPLAAKKYKGKWVGNMMEFMIPPIFIEQNSPDRQALKMTLERLAEGVPVLIAPEGTRSRTGTLKEAFEGTAYLLRKADVPIVPIAVMGTEKTLRSFRAAITVRVGKPFRLPQVEKMSKEQLKEDTDRLMCSIAALLPESYHGFYAGHPLIEEMRAVVA